MLLIHAFTYAQNNFVVEIVKYNTLYFGIENPISIAVPQIDSKNVWIEAEGGTFNKIDDSQYILIPKSLNFNIRVFTANNNDTLFLGKRIFKVKYIPLPDVYIGNYKLTQENAHIKNRYLLSTQNLYLKYDNIEINIIPNQITSFEVLFVYKEKTIEEEVHGNLLPPNIIKMIHELPENTQIIFKNISSNNQILIGEVIFTL
jgi:hypothetical protein